jgi:RNA polymerase sigma factor (sigma-70 family)
MDLRESVESDAAIIANSVAHPAVFAALYERHLERVAAYLARRVGSALAEDLTAEVFVRAFRARTAYRAQRETALPWLLGIASNLVGDHRRAERRRLAALQRLAHARPQTMHDDIAVLAPETIRQLRRLPAVDRDTLLLVVWGELSYEEAAAALGVPVGTVRSRIARARGRLARAIAAEATTPAGGEPAAVAARGETDV